MSDFENFYDELLSLASRYEKNNVPLKIEKDIENNIIKIFGENITSLARAKNGLSDVSELALATAEHHPFWNLLYNCSEISDTILEKWKSELSRRDIDDIEWAIRELSQTIHKLKE
jgi:hypothetical protein